MGAVKRGDEKPLCDEATRRFLMEDKVNPRRLFAHRSNRSRLIRFGRTPE
jgi:hypothetical protein